MKYIAIIHKEQHSDYGVSFPDLPGCVTAGSTEEEAKTLAVEILSFHIEAMLEDKETLPKATDLETILQNPDFAHGTPFYVEYKKSNDNNKTSKFTQ